MSVSSKVAYRFNAMPISTPVGTNIQRIEWWLPGIGRRGMVRGYSMGIKFQ
jgi:hypothetical protein